MANLPNRDAIEKALLAKLLKLFDPTRREIVRIWRDKRLPQLADVMMVMEGFRLALQALLTPELEDIYALSLEANEVVIGLTVDWATANLRAADWATRYTFDLVRGVTDTQRKLLQQSVDAFYRQGLDLGGLTRRLERDFGERRARNIAVTETTRAASQAEVDYVTDLRNAGVEMQAIWVTNADDIVCPICGPLNGKPRGEAWETYPPLHPGCRCWIRHEIVLPGKAAIATAHESVIPTLEMAQAARRGLKMQDGLGYGSTSVQVLVAKAIAERQAVTLGTVQRLRHWLIRDDDSMALCGGAAGREWANQILREVT